MRHSSQRPVLPGLFMVQIEELPPIAPSADLTAKHCSSMGALKIAPSRENLWERMLRCYAEGPCTDAELAERIGVPCSTISARRSELIKQRLVDPVACGTRKNRRTGVSNALWQLRKDV